MPPDDTSASQVKDDFPFNHLDLTFFEMQSGQMRLKESNRSCRGSHPHITPPASRWPCRSGDIASENRHMPSRGRLRQHDTIAVHHPQSAFRFLLSVLLRRL